MGHVFSPFAAGGGSSYSPYTPQPAAPSSQYPLHPAAPPPPPPHQGTAGPPPPPRHPAHRHHPITCQLPSQQQQPPPRAPPHMDTQSPAMIQHCSPPHSGMRSPSVAGLITGVRPYGPPVSELTPPPGINLYWGQTTFEV